MFGTILSLGHDLIGYFEGLFDALGTKIADLLPKSLAELIGGVPILNEVTNSTLGGLIFGSLLVLVIVYSLVKWLLP